MEHYSSPVLNAPLLDLETIILIASRHGFGKLSRPANFRRKCSFLALLEGRLLSCYTFINR